MAMGWQIFCTTFHLVLVVVEGDQGPSVEEVAGQRCTQGVGRVGSGPLGIRKIHDRFDGQCNAIGFLYILLLVQRPNSADTRSNLHRFNILGGVCGAMLVMGGGGGRSPMGAIGGAV